MRIRSIDMRLIDDLFEMGGGYVLDFNNRTFAEFFQDELGIDIDDLRYAREGTSKAKRLRYFLRTSSQSATVAVLRALWEYRQDAFRRRPRQDQVPDAESEFKSLLRRLGGKDVSPERTESELSGKAPDSKRADVLKQGLIEISQLEPQPADLLSSVSSGNSLTPTAWRPELRSASWGSRLMGASSCLVRPIYLRPDGELSRLARRTCMLSTERSRRRRRGPVGSLSATVASQRMV